jgi:hypothetical protein
MIFAYKHSGLTAGLSSGRRWVAGRPAGRGFWHGLGVTEPLPHAVDDSAARLRRIERDLHDGAQAQMVA